MLIDMDKKTRVTTGSKKHNYLLQKLAQTNNNYSE